MVAQAVCEIEISTKPIPEFKTFTTLPACTTTWVTPSPSSLGHATWEATLIDSIQTGIKGFAKQGQLGKAFKVLSLLLRHGITYNLHSISSILHSVALFKSLPEGKQLHAHSIVCGFHHERSMVTRLVTMYAHCGSISDSRLVIERSQSADVLAWNVLISSYVKSGLWEEAIDIYRTMARSGVGADNFTYSSLLKACGEILDLNLGREIHRNICRSGVGWNIFVYNSLVTMYARCGEVGISRQLFDQIPERDVVSWNAMIGGYAQLGMWEKAFALFGEMRTHTSLTNVITWNTIAGGNMQVGKFEEALKLVSEMGHVGVQFDSVSLVVGLTASAHLRNLKFGKEIHGCAIRSFRDEKDTLRNALITMYSRCMDYKSAHILFENISEKSMIAWNAMLAGYAHSDLYEDASSLFREMVSLGIKLNYVTLASIIPLCARVANIQHSRELHTYLIKNGYEHHLLLWNSLVDIYCKSGRIFDAHKVFSLIPEKDEISYTVMIAGYGMQGKGQEALKLFDEMQKYKLQPDHITMVAVLSACSHSGLVEEGRIIFDKMIKNYKVRPRMEHYACIMDILGRAGLLKEAHEIISEMPFAPSAAIQATLIGACQIHRNMKIGEWAARKLLDMKPEHPGYYVLVANMYTAAGLWAKLAEVRTLMRDRGLKKPPGCTWIELDGKFHPFLVADRTNVQAQNIFLVLELLTIQMKDVGYVASRDYRAQCCELLGYELQNHIGDLFHIDEFEEVKRFGQIC